MASPVFAKGRSSRPVSDSGGAPTLRARTASGFRACEPSQPPPRKLRRRSQFETPVVNRRAPRPSVSIIPGPPRVPVFHSDPYSPNPATLDFSNDVLLASIIPPSVEPLSARVEKRFEAWSRKLERWQARVTARLGSVLREVAAALGWGRS